MRKLRTAWGTLLFFVAWAASASGHAQPPPGRVIHPDDQWRLAEMFFERGDADRATTEFERFVFFFPEDERAAWAGIRIGEALLNTGRFETAIAAFNRVIEDGKKSEAVVKAHFLLAETYRRWDRHGQALIALQNLLAVADRPEVTDEALFQMGWTAVEAGAAARGNRFFSQMTPEGRKRHQVDALEAALEEMKHLPHKNPGLSGTLSVIPGLGYLYCERPKDAAMAFAVNGTLMAAAWEAFENDLPVLGALVTLVELGFYGGNIYGGINAAHKYNRSKRQRFIDSLRSRFDLSVGVISHERGLALGIRGSF